MTSNLAFIFSENVDKHHRQVQKTRTLSIKPKLQGLNLILAIYLSIIIHDCTALLSKFMNKYYWMIFHKQCIYALSNKKK